MRMSDKPSELPTSRRENVGADDNSTISARLAQICYVLVCLHALFFGYFSLANWNSYYLIILEDSWVENLTAVVFLLAGVVLFVASLINRRIFPRCVYVLGGMMMLFFAGEEISWGQRIIGFETPDFLVDLNYQSEFNIHNIRVFNHDYIFIKLQPHVLLALCIAGSAAFFSRKDRIFGIPLPPIVLTLAVLALMAFAFAGRVLFTEILPFIVSGHRGLLLLLLLFALLSHNARLFITAAVPMALALSTSYMINHNQYIPYLEVYEYMLSVVCFFYALAASLDNGVARPKIVAVLAALKPAAALISTLINSPPPPRQNRGVFVGISSGLA